MMWRAAATATLLASAPWMAHAAASPATATTTTATTTATTAIVTLDQTSLRAAPRDSAAQQAVLWQGDALEVRGEKLGYLQVYDHRRERTGYVLATQVRKSALVASDAPGLLAVLGFVRDTPGMEALGIGYAAAYLKAAPAGSITAEPFDALGSMAERLARRASLRQGPGRAADAVAAHLEVAGVYGLQFKSHERDGAIRLCYEGDAFRRVFSLAATGEQRARAALALTRHDCIDPATPALARAQLDQQRAEWLDHVEPAQWAQLPDGWKNRVRQRRAGVWSAIAFTKARQGESAASASAARRALDELAAVNRLELSDDDFVDYTDAAVRVGAVRWAAEPVAAATGRERIRIVTTPGEPGETCVALRASDPGSAPLAQRCTYGIVWAASASPSADGRALALAVQPLEGWRELWVFRLQAGQWTVDVLPPAASHPELGYLEFAGWVPGGAKLLLAREARVDGRFKRSFEVADTATLNTEKQASVPTLLVLFGKWQDAAWKRASVSLR